MTPAQCRAARALLGRSLADLEKATNEEVPERVMVRFEEGAWIHPADIAAMRAALERAGVEFIEGGVRMRKGEK